MLTQKMIVFCNFLEIKAETKKSGKGKSCSNWVLYSCVKYERLKLVPCIAF